jgi:hypothetical protein
MDSGAGQNQRCRATLHDVRRQRGVRRAVWPLSEELCYATPATPDPSEVAVARVLTDRVRGWCSMECRWRTPARNGSR